MNPIRSQYSDSVQFFGVENPLQLVKQFGSPLYVYNEKILRERCRDLVKLSNYPGYKVNFSAKANTNPELLKIIREEGCVVDAMSPGELFLDQYAGFTKEEITYVCNNVSAEEFKNAAANSHAVSVDSLSQLELFGKNVPSGRVMLRINPGIGAGHSDKVVTGGKKTKFGISPEELDKAESLIKKYNLVLAGVNQHIGSLFMDAEPYVDAANILLGYAESLLKKYPSLEIIDFGGGFGIPYHKYEGEKRLDLAVLSALLDAMMKEFINRTGYKGKFFIEPGRYIAAESSFVLGTVHAVKSNAGNIYAGTDIGFNVLARPMLYDAFHDVEIYSSDTSPRDVILQTIVGNICETGDISAKNRELPRIKEEDIIGIADAGAYGWTMASNYNSRLRPAEVLIEADGKARLIRRAETLDDLMHTLKQQYS